MFPLIVAQVNKPWSLGNATDAVADMLFTIALLDSEFPIS